MIALVIVLSVTGAGLGIWVALAIVLRAVKHGLTFGGMNALLADLLDPQRAWLGFALVAASIVLTTTAGILSLFV